MGSGAFVQQCSAYSRTLRRREGSAMAAAHYKFDSMAVSRSAACNGRVLSDLQCAATALSNSRQTIRVRREFRDIITASITSASRFRRSCTCHSVCATLPQERASEVATVGHVTNAECSACGYSKSVRIGGGMRTFEQFATWPIFCGACNTMTEANYQGNAAGVPAMRIARRAKVRRRPPGARRLQNVERVAAQPIDRRGLLLPAMQAIQASFRPADDLF
jgi:hypothetical protein